MSWKSAISPNRGFSPETTGLSGGMSGARGKRTKISLEANQKKCATSSRTNVLETYACIAVSLLNATARSPSEVRRWALLPKGFTRTGKFISGAKVPTTTS